MKGYNASSMSGRVFSIQRMSTEDGPGIRTTVFLKGCSLACAWCHNPESISGLFQVQWIGSRCIGCKTCMAVCPHNALNLTESGMAINRNLCEGCGKCAEECPSTAMELIGKDWKVEALAVELEKDRAYFANSGGGVTVSGGEPTLQADFTAALLETCVKRGLHTALDTCGQCPPGALDKILPHAGMVLFDVKCLDPQDHRRFTGRGNQGILENLLRVRDWVGRNPVGRTLWVRTPLIPGATATVENVTAIGAFLAREAPGALSRWELCAFNNLCRDKYVRLGLAWEYAAQGLLDRELAAGLEAAAKQSGLDPEIVFVTGAAKLEDGT